MKFKVGDTVYWGSASHRLVNHWKILEICDINHAKIELVKRGDHNAGPLGTKLKWRLTTALLVKREKRSHPLTNIFKD